MPEITKRAVGAIVLHEREHVVGDDEIKGFGVRFFIDKQFGVRAC